MIKRRIKGRKSIIILSSIILLSFALMTINIRHGKGPLFFESLILSIFSPFQSMFTHTVSAFSSIADHYILLVAVTEENKQLKKEVDRLLNENNILKERVLRRERVAKFTDQEDGRESFMRSPVVLATVIGRDATQWSKMVFIDKGTSHGIQENHPVVTNAGIVGHVIQSARNTSKVLLITDSRSAVDSLFQNTRTNGVVVGAGDKVCSMQYVPNTAEVSVGDRVLSSGLGGIFPKGLMVGRVSRVMKKKQGLFQDIEIIPSANFSRLEEVLVLLP